MISSILSKSFSSSNKFFNIFISFFIGTTSLYLKTSVDKKFEYSSSFNNSLFESILFLNELKSSFNSIKSSLFFEFNSFCKKLSISSFEKDVLSLYKEISVSKSFIKNQKSFFIFSEMFHTI